MIFHDMEYVILSNSYTYIYGIIQIKYNLKSMSENELMVPGRESQREIDDEILDSAIINAYQPDPINELAAQESLRQFYRTLDFPCCGDYLEPSLQPIADKKKEKQKNFVEGREMQQLHKISQYDGIYDNVHAQDHSATELIRLKSRLIRDKRQQFFQQNAGFMMDNQFFYEHLSRLANISFEENQAIRTFQKNAILSERNNQKKSMPFELQINLGCIWVTRHQLQNQEQKKFEELRPLLKEFCNMSTYPTLSEISREIKYLLRLKQQLIQTNSSTEQIQQVIRKVDISTTQYNKEVDKMSKLMKEILEKWRELKEIRRTSGMETVPWKLNVKEYEIQGIKSFDIGINPIEISDKPSGLNAESELNRRRIIREQMYFIRIYINGYEVAKSQKFALQWPSFRVPINQKFNVTVYSAPSSIQVEVLKAGIINRSIDTISLHLPGQYSKTITSSERRFAGANFSSNGYKARKGQEQPASPSGIVIYRIQWKGEGSRMPPVSFKSQQQETAPSEQSEEEEFKYELYDIKDPRVHHKTKKQEVEAEIIRGHGALLPFIDTQSARHLLLKMKATQPQFQKLEVPLTEEQIRKRQDLLKVIDSEKQKIMDHVELNEEIYNPIEGLFKGQDQQILKEIKELLYKIQNQKINVVKGATSAKYKITEQIINEYIFEKMESPIVVFFKNLFTQKRKLGPKVTYYLQARNVLDNMEVNIHVRSARNVPIRQTAFAKIRHFQDEFRMNSLRFQEVMGHTGNMDMYANYGNSFFQRPPNMNIQGQNFFVPGLLNLNLGRPNFQANYKMPTLERNNSYVEMRFKKMLKRTQCFEGPYPEWNQTIEFDYNLKQEQMTIPKLYANNEKMVKLFLFDMIEESKPTTSIAQARIKKTKYYLGRIDIPMSMMVAIPSLSGLFAIERPLIIFGYGIKKAGLFDNEPDPQQASKTQYPETLTLVNLDVFTDPLIDNIHAYNTDRKFVTGAQSTLLLQRSSDWLSDLNTTLYIRLWLNNIDGKSIFICKFLGQSIQPPPQFENSIQRCARFVSLIPKKYTCKLMENTEQFHLTCDQFLNMKMGEDHGILLCNYFNYIDKRQGRGHIESYLAIGKAFPYGKSIFVLRKDTRTGNCQLWDPYAGYCYFLPCVQYDTLCCFFKYAKKNQSQNPKDVCNMFELATIVTPTNVFINLQESLKPNDIDFNFEDKSLWKPFLTQRMRSEYFQQSLIESIQPQITQEFYARPRDIQVSMSQMERTLFQYLRTNLETERKKHFKPYTFKINQNISEMIRNKLLLECQTFKMDYRLTGQDSTLYMDYQRKRNDYQKALQELEQEKNKIKAVVDSDRTLYGFTLNMPFTTSKDIWQKVQETQIHLDQTQDIQFVLAVRLFEIACHIFSVWVFVGSIS